MKVTVPLWEHQKEARDYITSRTGTLFLGSCGIGKTLASLAAVEKSGARRVLILTVRHACRNVWEQEFIENIDLDPGDYLILDNQAGTIKQRKELLDGRRNQADLLVVTNYEAAKLLNLGDCAFDAVIADEGHRLKAHNSKTSMGLAEALRHTPMKVSMSGTPFSDKPTDVFGQERFLFPGKKGSNYLTSENLGSWSDFFERHVYYRERDNIKIPMGYHDLDLLASSISDHFLYINRDEVLDLPPVQHIKRIATLTDEHMDAYDDFEKEMFYSFENGEIVADNQLVLELRLHQMAGGYYQPMDGGDLLDVPSGSAKLDVLEETVEEVGKEPMIIFARFTEDIRRIRAMLASHDISSAELSGKANDLDLWQRNAAQVLVAQIQAGGVGLNLTRAAVVIMYSTGNSATDYTQALYRIDRPGQTRKVTIYHIIAAGTVDETIHERLTTKKVDSSNFLAAMERPARRTLGRVIRNG